MLTARVPAACRDVRAVVSVIRAGVCISPIELQSDETARETRPQTPGFLFSGMTIELNGKTDHE
ncbi:hypothetical protein DZK25_09970 [Wenzhouxiangella sp. 15181]|nr:hypothetical protein DZK25_09970 [Wenzhouxiangella sp. 15181]RFP69439.1 hypothetical protein DZK26_03460 [Wenzhouxiangella sp. 15190]